MFRVPRSQGEAKQMLGAEWRLANPISQIMSQELSKHLKGQLGTASVTSRFFNQGAQMDPPVRDVLPAVWPSSIKSKRHN